MLNGKADLQRVLGPGPESPEGRESSVIPGDRGG